jgi:hypothetical protein
MTDRDRLEKLYEKAVAEYGKTNKAQFKKSFVCDYLIANGVIVQKQGEWKKTKEPLGWQDIDCVECSVCHETWILDEDFDFDFCKEVWHYCPKCGAKLKEREG